MNIDTSTSIWQGQKVRLRAIEPSDWETYFAWNQDDEPARVLYFIPFPQSQEAVKRFAEQTSVKKPEDDSFRFVIENRDGQVIGDLSTNHCDRRTGCFGYGITTKKRASTKRVCFRGYLTGLALLFSGVALSKGHNIHLQF